MPIDKKTAAEIVSRLEQYYPDATCALEYENEPWKLLIMGRLSAQCTDARVNIVSRVLFERFPTIESVAGCDIAELEEIVRPCGLYKVKAKNIKDSCIMLINDFGGRLPETMEDLLRLPGVGRKIANLLLGDVYRKPAIVTDTHCIRICGRLGFYPENLKDPYKIEKILSDIIEPEKQSDFCHRIVNFGREVCSARSPRCETGGECPLSEFCAHFKSLKK
jgi:endonuclease-3